MLELAAERADGAHPYLVPPEHTRRARQILGPTALLCPEVAVVLESDPERARRIARAHLGTYLQLVNYRANLARLGYGEDDLADAGSDRLVDEVVAWGPLEQASARVHQHLEAGADHVAVQVLTEDRARLPLDEWRALATSNLFQ
jgi:probable F420-dependent oxidoreductase